VAVTNNRQETENTSIRHLIVKNTTISVAKTQYYNGEKQKGRPADGLRPAHQGGGCHHQGRADQTDAKAPEAAVDDVGLHEIGHRVEMVGDDFALVVTEHMDLRLDQPPLFQFQLNLLQVIETIADKVMPFH